MATNSFKIKKSINIEPIDPTTVTNPEAGDIIIDSTDDNRLKLFNPTAAEFETISGSGSSNNLMSDFEKLTPTVSNVVAVAETVTFLPIDDNKKSIKATFSSTDGFIRYQVPVTADLEGVQGVVSLWIKTSVENLSVVATKDGVAQNNGLTVNSSNKWRQYEVPVVFGAADYGFEVRASGSVSGDVFIDEAFVKVDSSMFVKNVSGAQYVGGLTAAGVTNCSWSGTSTSFANFAADTDCNAFTANGNIKAPSTKVPAFVIPAGSPIGTYLVDVKFYVSGSSDVGVGCRYRLSDGIINSKTATFAKSGTSSNGVYSLPSYYINVTDTNSDRVFNLQHQSLSGTCTITFANTLDSHGFDVYYFPDSTSTIVTQNTELTAKTANEFVANVSSTGVVSGENFDWLSVSKTGTGAYSVTFTSGVFSQIPVCLVRNTGDTGADLGVHQRNETLSGFDYVTRVTLDGLGAALTDSSVSIKCTRSTDYNKSATIIGKFENINSSELCQVEAVSNDAEVITAQTEDIPFKTIIKDNCNNWSNAGNTGSNTNDAYTAKRDSLVLVTGVVAAAVAVDNYIGIHVNGTLKSSCSQQQTTGRYSFSCMVELLKDDVLTIRLVAGNNITLAASTLTHRISITELPDTESIIKNLSNQKTKCQTKYLSAQVSTSGTMSDLTFNNISTGKRYRLYTKGVFLNQSGVEGVISIIHDSNTISTLYSSDYNTTPLKTSSTSDLISFVATNTSITFSATSDGNSRIAGNGTRNNTFAELCELPDTYVETDEW